jgi:hypothetical protein
MTGSFVHAAFDPFPYILFSICVLAIGVGLEIVLARAALHRIASSFARRSRAHAFYGAHTSRLHPLASAKH